MHRLLLVLSLAAALLPNVLRAQNATVVELYTSQGCSSCPPADELLTQLAARDDVIALALHVDYWDYLGWKDDMAQPAFSQRQHGFAQAAGATTVYTPQMVIGGLDHVIGSRPMKVMEQVMRHNALPDAVAVTLSRSGNRLTIDAEAVASQRGRAIVQIVRFDPEMTRDIRRGENAGRTIRYSNVVTSWTNAGAWNMAQPLRMQADLSGSERVAVIIQDGANGPILGAAQLR